MIILTTFNKITLLWGEEMTYADYKKFRIVEVAEMISDFLMDCSYQDCGLTNQEKGELRYLLSTLEDHILQ